MFTDSGRFFNTYDYNPSTRLIDPSQEDVRPTIVSSEPDALVVDSPIPRENNPFANVEEMRREVLSQVVSRREKAIDAVPLYALRIAEEISKMISKRFHFGFAGATIIATSNSTRANDDETIAFDNSLSSITAKIKEGFFPSANPSTSALIPFDELEVSPHSFAYAIGSEICNMLEDAGYDVEISSRHSEAESTIALSISWHDEEFIRAWKNFSDESQLDAYLAGVPVEDILA